MRVVICSIIGVAIVGGFLMHRHKEETPPVAAAPKPAQTQTVAAAPQQNSPHNWMKNSLDRAGDVKRQVSEQRKESGDIYGR